MVDNTFIDSTTANDLYSIVIVYICIYMKPCMNVMCVRFITTRSLGAMKHKELFTFSIAHTHKSTLHLTVLLCVLHSYLPFLSSL